MTRSAIHRSQRREYFGSERGQAGLFVALNLTLICGVLALAVDLGLGYYTKLQAQSAADAAAMAAATYASSGGPITCGSNHVTCAGETPCAYPVGSANDTLSTGCAYAAANGFVNHGNQTVTMSGNTTAPAGITGNTPTYWVKATVSANPTTLFAGFGGLGRLTIRASSTSAVAYYSAGACIYVLDPTASGALSAQGSTSVVATCGIFINSNSSSALSLGGNASVTSTNILVNGSSSIGNNASVVPTPTNHAGAQADPIASTVTIPPVTSACDYINYSFSSGGSVTLPGDKTYCGGIAISGGNVTFGPGVYTLDGGGLSIQGNSVVTGSGVTFFNTYQYGQSRGNINTAGSASLTLSSPTSGTYEGMLFIEDPHLSWNSISNTLSGTSGSSLTGTLYFPNGALNYTGTTSSGSYTAIIAGTVTFTGTSNFKNDPTGYYTGLGTTVRGLIQ
jgi:hypothetical protein